MEHEVNEHGQTLHAGKREGREHSTDKETEEDYLVGFWDFLTLGAQEYNHFRTVGFAERKNKRKQKMRAGHGERNRSGQGQMAMGRSREGNKPKEISEGENRLAFTHL